MSSRRFAITKSMPTDAMSDKDMKQLRGHLDLAIGEVRAAMVICQEKEIPNFRDLQLVLAELKGMERRAAAKCES